MTWWQPHQFAQKQANLKLRSSVMKALRNWFDTQNFTEVDTPILQSCPVMDAHIHGFETQMLAPDLSHKQTLYLQTSPEFSMKKLLVAGMAQIYQIAHVFRNGEDSPKHLCEFTMLEWYRAGADYHALMQDCQDLIQALATAANVRELRYKGHSCNPFAPWQKISVAQAFKQYANIDLDAHLDNLESFKEAAQLINIRITQQDQWDDVFYAIMDEKIEPFLGQGAPTILYDYPLCMASLARRKEENPNYAERFELYICGVELANAFSELTNAAEQRQRFMDEMALKEQLYGYSYPLEEDFLKAIEHGLPESAGIALGLDRLLMLLCGAVDINDVIWAET